MLKKHLALYNGYIPVKNFLVLGHSKLNRVAVRKEPVDELTEQVGGLIVSDRNIYKGGKVNKVLQRRPIRFIV
jgi:hypothetical protein